jgi:Na+/melibiose symporter-like transporter
MSLDTVEYCDWKTGKRSEGITMALIGFLTLLGASIVGGLNGWVMDLSGFVANAEQSESALRGIVMLMTMIPLVFSVISNILIHFYELDESLYGRIPEEPKVRKTGGKDA